MSSWAEIAREIEAITTPNKCDIVRRNKLRALSQLTRRNTILYATDFLSQKSRFLGTTELSINLVDKDGFVEVTKNLTGDQLDVVLQSPGGSAEAAESIVDLLRAKFSDIRFIIPSVAKSAATMMTMSGNLILMDERSELGPTDPQMLVNRDGQIVTAPAHDIKKQFEMAKKDIKNDPQILPSWLPILRQYGPSLLSQCDTSLKLSNKLVAKWLKAYMFHGDRDPGRKAARVAQYLTSKTQFQSHSRKVGIDDLLAKKVKILDLRTNPALQNAIWDLHLALQLTFSMTDAYKIFENHNNEALIKQLSVRQAIQPQTATPQQQPPQSQPRPNRQARRHPRRP